MESSGHPVAAEVTDADSKGQFFKKQALFVRLNNATRDITDEAEQQRYIAHRWGT